MSLHRLPKAMLVYWLPWTLFCLSRGFDCAISFARLQGLARHLAAVHIDDHGQVQETGPRLDISHVAHLQTVGVGTLFIHNDGG